MHQRKDGVWAEIVRYDGKRKDFYASSKAELKRKIAAYSAAQEHGITVADAVDEWLEVKETLVSYKTAEGYKAPIKRIKDALGDEYLKDVTPAQIQAFVRSIAQQGFKRSTVQRPLDILNMVYDYHITKRGSMITENPCAAVKMPSGLEQERREIISREDAELVKKGVDLPFGLYAYLLLYTGLRRAEALALTDKDFTDDEISISKSVSWQPNKPVIKEPKTHNGIRTVPLMPNVKERLPKWHGYLFSADGGKSPLTQTQFRKRWDGYCQTAGLADYEIVERVGANRRKYKRKVWTNRIVPTQLRHEFATMCLDSGLEAIDTKEIMGHAKVSTTQKIYQHILNERRDKSAQKLRKYVQENAE